MKILGKGKYIRTEEIRNKMRGENNPHFGKTGVLAPSYKGGKPYCVDCGKEVWWTSKKCKSCYSRKMDQNPRWKGGISKEIKNCEICGVQTSDYRYKRCGKCSKKGIKLSKEHKEKICKNSPKRYGAECNFWNGGVSKLQRLIRECQESSNWRKSVFEKDNYTCQECSVRGGYLESHHKKLFVDIFNDFLKEYSQFSPIEDKDLLARIAVSYKPFWDIENGKTLCRECHDKTKTGRI